MPNLTVKIPAIEKLSDYAVGGVGAIAGPMLASWKASKEGKARIVAAQADAEVRLIEAESEARTSEIIAKARSEAREFLLKSNDDVRGTVEITREDITQSIEFQSRKRLANVQSVVEDAAGELGDKEVPDHEPDPDWTARFFDCVQDVSSEDMQKIWGKILAGEVESPGRTSLRTLDTLQNMTRRDAELFRDICDFVLWNDCMFYNDSVKGIGALNYNNLLHLQDCGLMNVGPNLMKELTWASNKEILFTYHNRILTITRDPDAKEKVLRIPEILLTTAGKELFRFAQRKWNMNYLQALSKFLKSNNCQLFYLEGAVPPPDSRIWYWQANRIPIEPQPEQGEGAAP